MLRQGWTRAVDSSLYAIAAVMSLVGLEHFLTDGAPFVWRLLELGVVVALALLVVVAGLFSSRRLGRAQMRYVIASTLGLGVLTALVSGLASAIQVLQGYSLNEPLFYAFVMGCGGAAAGPYVGYLYARLESSHAELDGRYAEIERLNSRLSVSNRVLRHNLRNGMAVIAGIGEELAGHQESNSMERRVELLNHRADKLVGLSEKAAVLRDVWTTDERYDADIVQALEPMLERVSERHPDVTLNTDLPASAEVTVHPRFETALEELLSNAVEHNDTAALEIHVRVQPGTPDDDWTTITVSDTGCGMPQVERDLFGRADPTESPLEHGIGLGLWLVYGLAEKSGGDLDVETDGGTTVRLTVPSADAGGDPTESDAPSGQPRTPSPAPLASEA